MNIVEEAKKFKRNKTGIEINDDFEKLVVAYLKDEVSLPQCAKALGVNTQSILWAFTSHVQKLCLSGKLIIKEELKK